MEGILRCIFQLFVGNKLLLGPLSLLQENRANVCYAWDHSRLALVADYCQKPVSAESRGRDVASLIGHRLRLRQSVFTDLPMLNGRRRQ